MCNILCFRCNNFINKRKIVFYLLIKYFVGVSAPASSEINRLISYQIFMNLRPINIRRRYGSVGNRMSEL